MIDGAAALIWCPFPDEAAARRAAQVLVGEELAACVNIVPAITSVYQWEGEVHCDPEAATLIKTVRARLSAAIARLEAIHPYDTPAIMAWECDRTPPGTLAWLDQTVKTVGQ